MQILRKLYEFSIPLEDLITRYIIFIRSILEQNAVIWHSSLIEEDKTNLERVQKVALRIIFKENYTDYEVSLQIAKLETLEARRDILCLSFAKSCLKHEDNSSIFPLNDTTTILNNNREKYKEQHAKKERLKKSTIPHMQRLLNSNEK